MPAARAGHPADRNFALSTSTPLRPKSSPPKSKTQKNSPTRDTNTEKDQEKIVLEEPRLSSRQNVSRPLSSKPQPKIFDFRREPGSDRPQTVPDFNNNTGGLNTTKARPQTVIGTRSGSLKITNSNVGNENKQPSSLEYEKEEDKETSLLSKQNKSKRPSSVGYKKVEDKDSTLSTTRQVKSAVGRERSVSLKPHSRYDRPQSSPICFQQRNYPMDADVKKARMKSTQTKVEREQV